MTLDSLKVTSVHTANGPMRIVHRSCQMIRIHQEKSGYFVRLFLLSVGKLHRNGLFHTKIYFPISENICVYNFFSSCMPIWSGCEREADIRLSVAESEEADKKKAEREKKFTKNLRRRDRMNRRKFLITKKIGWLKVSI